MSYSEISGKPVSPTRSIQPWEEGPWHELPWKKFERVAFRLQKRIYKAKQRGDERTARNLQKLLMKSRAARFLAVRRVSQLNSGKRTAGIDGQAHLTVPERYQIVEQLSEAHQWNHQGLREIPIPKADGSQRLLKIPTLRDRAWQTVVAMALEPLAEATFHANSYGFRPGRGCWDAQRVLWSRTRKRTSNFSGLIYELDIKKCFDRIDHQDLIKRVELPKPYQEGLWRALKAGIHPDYPEQGTPQGGPISPLLANIALNGIEELGACVRYADDMVFVIRCGEEVDALKQKIDDFLAIRGLEIKAEKSCVVEMAKGFNFLGFSFKKLANGTARSYPQDDSFKRLRGEVKKLLKSPLAKKWKAEKIGSKVRGWLTYYRNCNMTVMSERLWKLNQTIYQELGGKYIKKAMPVIPWKANGHNNVKGNKSPYDGDWTYWSKRQQAKYHGRRAKLLKRQNGKCLSCGHYFMESDEIHLHHLNGNHSDNRINNVVMVHRSCHMNEHSRRHAEERTTARSRVR